MDPRSAITLFYVAAIVLPLVALVWTVAESVIDHRMYKGSAPGTVDDFDIEYATENRKKMRSRLVRRPVRELALVGGSVVLASVAGIWSLYL